MPNPTDSIDRTVSNVVMTWVANPVINAACARLKNIVDNRSCRFAVITIIKAPVQRRLYHFGISCTSAPPPYLPYPFDIPSVKLSLRLRNCWYTNMLFNRIKTGIDAIMICCMCFIPFTNKLDFSYNLICQLKKFSSLFSFHTRY